eukprot:6231611-Pyramimonas_sp.AAC.1
MSISGGTTVTNFVVRALGLGVQIGPIGGGDAPAAGHVHGSEAPATALPGTSTPAAGRERWHAL